jgi:hypothetical protein
MFEKNSIKNGGSFYIQSKIHNAKEILLKDHPGFEEKYLKENNLDSKEEEATEEKND